MPDSELERIKAAPDVAKFALNHIAEAVSWLEEGAALFQDPPESHLPNGADVDEMKDMASGYLNAAVKSLRHERTSDAEAPGLLIDMGLPRPGFLDTEERPYEFEVELCRFFVAARREYPYWRHAFPA